MKKEVTIIKNIGFTKLFLKKLRKLNNNLNKEINETVSELYDRASLGYDSLLSYLVKDKRSKLMEGCYREYKIYKFYASNGARVIYSYGSDVNDNYLLCLLNIEVEHKKQGQTAKKKIKLDMLDYNKEVSYLMPLNPTKIFKEYDYRGCIAILDGKQEKCLRLTAPCCITGNAGTGKTLISMRLMLDNELNGDSLITYITLTDHLKNMVLHEFEMELNREPKRSAFKSLNDLTKDYNMATYQDFLKFYQDYLNEHRKDSNESYTAYMRKYQKYFGYDSLRAYQIIRRDIKGRMKANWDRDWNVPLLSLNDFILEMQNDFEDFDVLLLEYLYDVCTSYQDYLERNNLLDENDIFRLMNKSFDKIILDEAQDFTELQIFRLFEMSNHNIFLIGDGNQIINASLFRPSRIKKLDSQLVVPEPFSKNYRSSSEINQFLLRLTDIRKEYINTQKAIDENYIDINLKETNKNAILSFDGKNVERVLEAFINKPNTAVIVGLEKDKEELSFISHDLYTINEAKGLEFKYVFLYNIASSKKKEWQYIFEKKAKTKKNSLYRYYFNVLYVAASRASENVIIYEDKFDFLKLFNLDYFSLDDDMAIEMISQIADDFDDYYEEILELEERFLFDEAILKLNSLPKSFNYDINNDLKRLLFKKNYYTKSSHSKEEMDEFYRMLDRMDYEIKEEVIIEDKRGNISFSGNYLKGFNYRKQNQYDIFPKCEVVIENKKPSFDRLELIGLKLNFPIIKYGCKDKKILNELKQSLKKTNIKKIAKENQDYFIYEIHLLPYLFTDNELYKKRFLELFQLECQIINLNFEIKILYDEAIKWKKYQELQKLYHKYEELYLQYFFK